MSITLNRRNFLTHSAAAAGGVALVSGALDELVDTAAGATPGVGVGKPKNGGSLTVGILSEQPAVNTFSGSQGKFDNAGFTIANAVYDPLFVTAADGKNWLPYLALSATPNGDYTQWTIALRHGVTFHDGTPFNAAAVIANFVSASKNATVGLAILPLIHSVTQPDPSDDYTVLYTLPLSYATFPINLSEQQIAYMAAPSFLSGGSNATPIGTGPFKYENWVLNEHSTWSKNTNYWRKDAAGRKLPYLSSLVFKPIPDDTARLEALQSGSIDIMMTEDGQVIKQLLSTPGVVGTTGLSEARDPEINCVMLNVLGKDFTGKTGAVNPSTLEYDNSLTSVLTDLAIRHACALAINRDQYLRVIDDGVGCTMNGIYRTTSPYYKNPNYPSYNPKAAKQLVAAYKKANNLSKVGFVIDIVAGASSQQEQFSFIQSQLKAVGIDVTARPQQQSVQINNAIFKQYEGTLWNQFGGTSPTLNYVWFDSGNFVNFAQNDDPVLTAAMVAGLAAPLSSPAFISNWAKVNDQMAKDIPYLWLDATVNAWGAKSKVQNWAGATAADSRTKVLNPDGGVCRFTETWIS